MDSMAEYMVSEAVSLQPIDREIIALLYQPIMGMTAHSLFTTLWGEVSVHSLERVNRHNWLWTTLNIDEAQFIRARQQLEGIGLLKTYQMTTSAGEESYIYELYPPYTPKDFFNDDVLSFLLLDCVGEERFYQLVEHFQPKRQIPASYQDISVNFNEVYHLSEWQYRHSTGVIQQGKNNYPDVKNDLQIEIGALDFSDTVFQDALALPLSQDKIAELLPTVHLLAKLYGFNELDLADFVGLASDGAGDVSAKQLQSIALKAYEMTQESQPDKMVELNAKDEFTSAERQVLSAANSEAPLEFITHLKQDQNAIVTTKERFMMQSAVKTAVPAVLINLITYYLLIGRGQNELSQTRFEGMLNVMSQMISTQDNVDIGEIYRRLPEIEESAENHQTLQLASAPKEASDWQKLGVPTNLARMFTEAERLRPKAFLKQIKNHYGAVITDKEEWRLRRLVDQGALPEAMLNMIIYKLVQQSETHELNALFDRVVNQMSQRWNEQMTLKEGWEMLPGLIDSLQSTSQPAKTKKQGMTPAWDNERKEETEADVKQMEEQLDWLQKL